MPEFVVELLAATADGKDITWVWGFSIASTVLHFLRHCYGFYMGRQRAHHVGELQKQVELEVTPDMTDDVIESHTHTLLQKLDLSQLGNHPDKLKYVMDLVAKNAPQVSTIVLPEGDAGLQLLKDSKDSVLELLMKSTIRAQGLVLGGMYVGVGCRVVGGGCRVV